MATLSTLLKHYPIHDAAYDETFTLQGDPRPHYQTLIKRLNELSSEELAYRQKASDLAFVNQGITFTVYGDTQGTERPFPFDLLPRILTGREWAHIEAGLKIGRASCRERV